MIPMRAEWINPFLEATVSTLETMAGMRPVRKQLLMQQEFQILGDISAAIGLSGPVTGHVVIGLPWSLAGKIVAAMVGGPVPEGELADGVGELVNVIAGQAKSVLGCQMSLPVVVTGKGHRIQTVKQVPTLVVVYELEGESFAIQVVLRA